MHPNPVFHTATERENLDWACERAFGVLAVSAPDAPPLMSHVPYMLSDDRRFADLHLMRSNPIARDGGTTLHARLAVAGPDAYVSPDWYEIDDQVPTWNYVAVHLSGTLERLPDADMPGLLARQSAFFEARLAPKTPWTLDKLKRDTLERLLRMIVPFRLHVTAVDGTWKLSQNKPEDARIAAANHVEPSSAGLDPAALAALMRQA